MNREDKSLLFKDLCARLPYGVICKSKYIEYDEIDGDDVEWDREGKLEVVGDDYVIINSYQCELDETKPYLRPLSSMTEEEKKELFQLMGNGNDIQRVDFYNSHFLDYRGLIEKGLAIEAPEGMY